MLAVFPFLLPVIGGWLAGCASVLLRRAGTLLGRGFDFLAIAAATAAVGAFGWALYWAWISSPAPAPITLARSLAGWGLAMAGGLLAGWGVRARGWKARRTWRAERDELRQPYRTIRRPIVVGLTIIGLGLGVLADRPAVWVCLAAIFTAWSVILELADWEQKQRLPACRDYMRRTPRYLPWAALRKNNKVV